MKIPFGIKGKRVKITTLDNLCFLGICSVVISRFENFDFYNRDEDSIIVNETMLFESEIASIEYLD